MKRAALSPSVLCLLILLLTAAAGGAQSIPDWQPNVYRATGTRVMYSGVAYQCVQAHTPQIGWEPPNTPALWQPVSDGGQGSGCSLAPDAPTGLAAHSTTRSSTTLSWSAVAAPSSCSISLYSVYQDGIAIGVTAQTSFEVTGLAASTTYRFSVAASDSAGASSPSPAVSVTTSIGSGTGAGCAAAWSAATVYVGGMTASEGGINYLANWWTQGQEPAFNGGPPGSGRPWTAQGACSTCATVPGAPTGVTASSTTGARTILSWNAATAAANCTITGYTVTLNGQAVGTTSDTRYEVTGLAKLTTYTFTVAAVDVAGSSPQSSPIRVTTGTEEGGGSAGKLFAPYIDISLTASQQLLTIQQQSGIKAFTLAFIVDNGSCQAAWGGTGQAISNDVLSNGVRIKSLVDEVRQSGGEVIVAFGGANGTDLSSACASVSQVQAMYQSVIDRYGVKMLDFDIEGGAVSNQAAIDLRNRALIGLKAANPGLILSYTLPVLPTGLVDSGLNLLRSVKASGLGLDVVNVMAMDYGSANDNGGQMGLSAVAAATATETQVLQAGLTSTIGVTPMIGINDTNTEVFQLSDAQMLLSFARAHSYVSRIALWSVSRDNGSCPGQTWASPICSGLAQSDYAFSRIFEAF